jgi:5-methylcytosine-specific restriction endonuclease McrA
MWAECRRDTDREHQFDKAKKNRHLNFMGVLENQCLVLNRSWQAVNVITVQAALSQMAAGAATAMNFADGNFVPVKWSDWLELPVREDDDGIRTPSRCVRAPRVIIAVNFNKVPLKRPRLTMRHLRERDGGRCAYTLKALKPEECSMEHIVPRSKGGATEWKNVILADKRINNIRGNRSLKEAGLTLKIQPRVPTAKPFHQTLARSRLTFPEWGFFVKK